MPKDLRQLTIATYDNSAQELAEYFAGVGARNDDIEKAFELAGEPSQARVLEIGCGDGRDAQLISKRAYWYQGFDVSKGLIKIAKMRLPGVNLLVKDAVTFEYPKDLDIVFAFASLLHLNEKEVAHVLSKVLVSLRPGGIFYISLKHRDTYNSEVKTDRFGERLFYYYNPSIIEKLAGESYEKLFTSRKTIGHTDWFEIALRKV